MEEKQMKEQEEFYIIHTYSRRQAIADGVLIDVTDEAKSFGFCIPVAITGNLISCYIEPDAACEALGQSFSGRLRDVLAVLSFEARKAKGDRLTFKVVFLMDAETGRTETVKILAIIGPGDEGEAVLTVMLPEDE